MSKNTVNTIGAIIAAAWQALPAVERVEILAHLSANAPTPTPASPVADGRLQPLTSATKPVQNLTPASAPASPVTLQAVDDSGPKVPALVRTDATTRDEHLTAAVVILAENGKHAGGYTKAGAKAAQWHAKQAGFKVLMKDLVSPTGNAYAAALEAAIGS